MIYNILEACGVSDPANRNIIYQQIKDFHALFQDPSNLIQNNHKVQDTIQEYGIYALNIPSRKKAIDTLYLLEDYGLFLVPVGVLEQWLKSFNIKGRKSEWIGEILDKLGQDENDANYVKPKNDDIWFFMDNIAKWLNGNRSEKKDMEQIYC